MKFAATCAGTDFDFSNTDGWGQRPVDYQNATATMASTSKLARYGSGLIRTFL